MAASPDVRGVLRDVVAVVLVLLSEIYRYDEW